VRFVVDELLDHGRVHRGYLGVKLDNAFDIEAATRLKLHRLCGARVLHVYRDTPAYSAGLQVDDVVINFDGIDVQDESHLIHRVSLTPVNTTVRVIVMRGGREVTLKVTLTERPVDPRAEQPAGRSPIRVSPGSYRHVQTGLKVQRLERGVAPQLGLAADQQGVLVTSAPNVHSTDDSLQLYDVIEEAARQPVRSVDDFSRIVAALDSDAPLLLKVRRTVDGEVRSTLVVWRPQPDE
jgi:serine protease Do